MLDSQLRLQAVLEKIRDVLNELVQSPAQPAHQSTLATALTEFEAAAAKLRTSITPSQTMAIAEMGGAEFFDPAIAEIMKSTISTNAMTPSVARDVVQDLATRRAAFLQTVKTTLQGLTKLNVQQTPLAAGQSDLSCVFGRHA